MSQIIPYMNPLRFHKSTVNIDYDTHLPTSDLMELRTNYQRGIYAQKSIYPDWSLNKEISIEFFEPDAIIGVSIQNVDTGQNYPMTDTDITPSGWVGDNILLFKYTPTIAGYYQIKIISDTYGVVLSNIFLVKDWSETKDLIRVEFYDSQNSNGGFFYNETTLLWSPAAYYTGFIKEGATEYDKKLYNDQPNNTTVLKNTPKLIDTLTITDVHSTYYRNISYQFSCDTVFVNGTQYAIEEIGEPNPIDEKSDLVNIIIKLSLNTNNGFQQIT